MNVSILTFAVKMDFFPDVLVSSSMKFFLVRNAHKNLSNHLSIPDKDQTSSEVQKGAAYIS